MTRAVRLLTVLTVLTLLCGAFLAPLAPTVAPLTILARASAHTAAHPLLEINEGALPDATSVTTQPVGFAPADLAHAYSLPRAVVSPRGAGRPTGTVVLVEAGDAPTITGDVAHYRAQFHIAAPLSLTVLNQQGAKAPLPKTDTDWALETALDADMVSALCPRCAIVIVEADGASLESLLGAEMTAARLHPDAISNSWGASEISLPPCPADTRYYGCYDNGDLAALFAFYFTVPGTAVTVSSGDDGYGVDMPADSPNVIAVGGTTLVTDTTVARGYRETAWGASVRGSWEGAGSGCSAWAPKPAWQNDRFCAHRTVADVSFVADPATGVAVYDSTPFYGRHHKKWYAGWIELGGTSVGAPAIAALYGLAHNARYMVASPPGAHLYANLGALNDITAGTNAIPCPCYKGAPYLRFAGPGYDGVTGNGTPRGLGAF